MNPTIERPPLSERPQVYGPELCALLGLEVKAPKSGANRWDQLRRRLKANGIRYWQDCELGVLVWKVPLARAIGYWPPEWGPEDPAWREQPPTGETAPKLTAMVGGRG